MSRDPARVRPGNQEINPGNPDQGGTGGNRGYAPLGPDARSLFDELIRWCNEAGPPATEKQLAQWRWRTAHKPHLVERCLRETQAVVREGRQLVRNRGGFVKMLWREWDREGDVCLPATAESRKAAGGPVESNAPTAVEPSQEEEERRRRTAESLRAFRQAQRKGHTTS